MEKIESGIRQTLQDLGAVGGLLPPVEDDDDDNDSHINGSGAVVDDATRDLLRLPDHHRQHTLRRLLRRLDRTLLRLEEHICSETESQVPLFSNELCNDLLTILTRLPLIDEESTIEMCLSILGIVARIWVEQDFRITDPQDVRTLLRRIAHQTTRAGSSRHHQQQQHSLFSQCVPWIKVVNVYFCDMHQAPALSADDAVWLLQQILLVALDSFRTHPSWDANSIQDAETEAVYQWRYLTTLSTEQVIQLYQMSQLSSETQQQQQQLSVLEWLEMHFRSPSSSSSTTTTRTAATTMVDLARPLEYSNSRNQNAARISAHELLQNLQNFADELIDFALDALDGAAAAVALVDTTNNHNEGEEYVQDEHGKADAVRDSLRQVVTALRFLQGLNDWSLVRPEWPLKLWKSLAIAFVVRPEYTEEEKLVLNDISSSIVHFTLTVLEMVLQLNDERCLPTTSLATTFLRALEYPERVLAIESFWSALKTNASQSNELKQVLQVAVLSLVSSSRNNSVTPSLSASSEASSQQALIHRILEVLPDDSMFESASQQRGHFIQNDPWDVFFSKRFNDMAK